MSEKKDPNDNGEATIEEDIQVVTDNDEMAGEEEVVVDPQDLISELEQKVADEHNRLLRTAAELENFRKRARRDIDDAVTRGRTEILAAFLPALDSIDLALKSTDPEGSASGVLEGVEMVRKQFLTSMAQYKLKAVDTEGQVFDPTFHEAVAQTPSADHPSGQIIQEMRKGYMLGDRLVRASMVVVSSGPPAGDTPEVKVEPEQTEEPPEETTGEQPPAEPESEMPAAGDDDVDQQGGE